MKKLLTLLLVAAMVLSLSVLASAVNCPTNEDVGYENSGYFFAQDARETTITIDGFKDDVFGETPSFSYKSTGNATEDNVGNFTDTKNWVYIGGGTWEDMQSIINPSNYVEGYFAWDTDYLYFFIHQDLGAFKQGQPANLMWQDYCIQIEFIDFKARTFSDWGCSVSQSTGETLQYCFVNGGCTCPEGETNYNVKVTADDSYVAYEGAIPVDDFFAKSAIEEGSTLGFNLCINFGDISQQGKQKCLTWAADNYHARSGDSAIPITLLGPSTTMEDALNAQAEAERMIKDAAEETDGKGVLFNGCNNTDGISGVTLTRETVKSGSGAWAFTLGEHNFRFTRDPVNASDFDSLEFDLYIGDDSVVSAMRSDNGCVELTSTGGPDHQEIAWNMSQILDGIDGGAKAGWNHVVLYFKDAGKTGGQRLSRRRGGSGKHRNQLFLGQCERILLLDGRGQEVVAPRKDLPDRAHLGRDMLDAVQYPHGIVTEDNIAVLAHQLCDQQLFAEISHLIAVFDMQMNASLQARLRDG